MKTFLWRAHIILLILLIVGCITMGIVFPALMLVMGNEDKPIPEWFWMFWGYWILAGVLDFAIWIILAIKLDKHETKLS